MGMLMHHTLVQLAKSAETAETQTKVEKPVEVPKEEPVKKTEPAPVKRTGGRRKTK
ncbi:MAG: hypothetical protein J6Y60_03580 [Treponema sp.]|nr:hypothetical protein [Treponema sp.]